eukprot:TRINITY_DN3164_c1_g2_i1.p1 TRINITY_DN3164_c1_g2~~TRINITY_DN3164_c1_g2_i1.p1  ORF type:complete len:645 (+),score=150.79 TRINITY_DN3164_c1_g2_i1:107-1936(+)
MTSYDDPRMRGGNDELGANLSDLRMLHQQHHRGAGDMEAPRSAVAGHHHGHHSNHGHHHSGHREDGRGLREDPRGLREDPRDARGVRDDPRGIRDDPRMSRDPRDDARGMREDPRSLRDDPRLQREDPRASHPLHQMTQHVPHGHHGLQQPPHPQHPGAQHQQHQQQHHHQQQQHHHQQQQQQHQQHQQHQHQQHQQNQQGGRNHPYVLPWEDTLHQEEAPPSQDYGNAPQQYSNDVDDKGGPADGRRSRQRRGQGGAGDNDWADQRPVGTPSNADRDRNPVPFGFGPGNGMPVSKGSRSGAAGFGQMLSGSGGPHGGHGGHGGAGNFFLGPGSGPTATGGGGGGGGGATAGGSTASSAARHGVSAGTGGSEEWPSNQPRNARNLREQEYEEPEKGVWAQGAGMPRRKVGRQPAPLGGVPTPQPRRSPDLVDPWQAQGGPGGVGQDRGEAWQGGAGQDALHAGGPLPGLPSIHSSLISGPQVGGLGDGSRVPSRLGAGADRALQGTPTPREEDMLDMASRGVHSFPSGARWTGGGPGGDWPGLSGGPVPPSAVGNVGGGGGDRHPTNELGPVRDARVPLHDVRMSQQDGGRALGGLRGRPDLGEVYHRH